ncbi:MAG: tetratricopeptide repeat protein [Candidatus Hermodarchaeota archaeon]
MSSPKNELIRAEEFIAQGKFTKALQVLENLEKMAGLSPHDLLTHQLLKSTLLNKLGRYEEGFKLAELVFKKSQGQEKSLLKVDAIIAMLDALWQLENHKNALELIEKGEFEIKTLDQHQRSELAWRDAYLKNRKASIYLLKNDLNHALEFFHQCLELFKEITNKQGLAACFYNIGRIYQQKGEYIQALEHLQESVTIFQEINDRHGFAKSLNVIGMIYQVRGELNRALTYFRQSLRIFKKIGNEQEIAMSFSGMAQIYRQKNELKRGLEYLQQSWELFKKIGNNDYISSTLLNLVYMALEDNSLKKAQGYSQQLQQINNQTKDKIISQRSRLAIALIMEANTQVQRSDKIKKLEQITQEEVIDVKLTTGTLLILCKLLLDDLKIANNQINLNKIKNLINDLLKIAQQQQLPRLIAEIYLLKSKLRLIEQDVKAARTLLTQSQDLAEKKGLSRLAMKISREHDFLLEQLSNWDELYERNASLAARADFAQIAELIVQMIQMRTTEISKVPKEQPVSLLILDKSGILIFSKLFNLKADTNDMLIEELLSTIQTFSLDILSQSFDRGKLNEYTVLIKQVEHFLVCYIFKGDYYFAQQKISHFIQYIGDNDLIKQVLNWAAQTNQPLGSTEQAMLEDTLNNIF